MLIFADAKKIECLYIAEVKTCQDNIMAELQVVDAQHQLCKEAEIRHQTELALDRFATNYYDTRKQAMIEAVDLTIRKERDTLLHHCKVELLPLSTGLLLNAACQALDDGLVESSNSTPNPPSQALPGASQMDTIIANLSDTLLTKIIFLTKSSNAKVNKLSADLDFRLTHLECQDKMKDVAAASGGGFYPARQVALIHKCATDNTTGHTISPAHSQ